MTSRQEANSNLLRFILDISKKEIFKLTDGFARSIGYQNLIELILSEANYLNIGVNGTRMYTMSNDPKKKPEELDINDLCHILKNSPSLGFSADVSWSQSFSILPFEGSNIVEACVVIREMWTKINDDLNETSTITEAMYITHAHRLFRNIIALGFDELALYNTINLREFSLNSPRDPGISFAEKSLEKKGHQLQANRTEEDNTVQKLSEIFSRNRFIDTSFYVAHLSIGNVLNFEEVEKIEICRFRSEKQLAFSQAFRFKGKRDVEALYNLAKSNGHLNFAQDIKTEFGLEN